MRGGRWDDKNIQVDRDTINNRNGKILSLGPLKGKPSNDISALFPGEKLNAPTTSLSQDFDKKQGI